MSTADPYFLAIEVYSHDEHSGVDRPVAAIIRVDNALGEAVATALRLIQQGVLLSASIPLGDGDVRWLDTVGRTGGVNNRLAPVPGDVEGGPAWMPADAVVLMPDGNLLDMTFHNDPAEEGDCVPYFSSSEPIVGASSLQLTRFDMSQPGVREDSPIHVAVHGSTTNYSVDTFLHPAHLLWPDLVPQQEPARPRERQGA